MRVSSERINELKNIAIVLAGGSGRRLGGKQPKQYMELCGKPLIYYCLKTFEESFIDEVVLVCREGDEEYCRKEIVDKFDLRKVTDIVPGGRERYDSVYNGLKACRDCKNVFIHDGARPFVTRYVLERCLHYVEKYSAAAAAVKAKDTIKLENGDGFIDQTPDRDLVWLIQTPQVFKFDMILKCYEKLKREEKRLAAANVSVTDDTMVAKMFADVDARLVESDYKNIKITTADDLIIAEAFLRE